MKAKKTNTETRQYLISSSDAFELHIDDLNANFILNSLEQIIDKVDSNGKFSEKGKKGEVKYFYFPKDKYEQLLETLKNHNMDGEDNVQFIWITIQMAFAHNIFLKKIPITTAQNSAKKEMLQLIELINGLIAGTFSIQKLKIEYKNKDGKTIPLTRTFSEQIILEQIESSLIFYQIANAENIKKEYEFLSTPSFVGIKHLKNLNNFYTVCSIKIFNYVSKINWIRINSSHSREKNKIISDRQIFLLIGKLMQIADIVKIEEFEEEEKIIDRVEKLLEPSIKLNNAKLRSFDLTDSPRILYRWENPRKK